MDTMSTSTQFAAISIQNSSPRENIRTTQKTEQMADGLNDIRAMRVAEIVTHYESLQQQIAACRVNVPLDQAQARGYLLLRQCHQNAQALLAQPINMSATSGTIKNDNETKRQLQKLIIDAAARRFKAHKLASQVTTVMRWVNSRQQILRGATPAEQHLPALQQVDSVLQTELAAITNQRMFNELHARDVAQQYWSAEMPSFSTLMSYIAAN